MSLLPLSELYFDMKQIHEGNSLMIDIIHKKGVHFTIVLVKMNFTSNLYQNESRFWIFIYKHKLFLDKIQRFGIMCLKKVEQSKDDEWTETK